MMAEELEEALVKQSSRMWSCADYHAAAVFSQPYLSNGRAYGMVVVRRYLSVCLSRIYCG